MAPNRLDITVITPEGSPWGSLELRFLIDGQDVISEVFDGPGGHPDQLLGPDGPLSARQEPAMARLAESTCSWECCGGIEVHIRREAGEVIWDQWHNPDVPRVPLGEFRFDAGQYDAELLRAQSYRTPSWPGRTIARLVRDALISMPEVMEQWNCSLDFAGSPSRRRSEVEIAFVSPPRRIINDHWERHGRAMEHTQYRLRVPVTDEPAQVQADRILTALKTDDPRASAEKHGGHTTEAACDS